MFKDRSEYAANEQFANQAVQRIADAMALQSERARFASVLCKAAKPATNVRRASTLNRFVK